jgi:hypothetical protein
VLVAAAINNDSDEEKESVFFIMDGDGMVMVW